MLSPGGAEVDGVDAVVVNLSIGFAGGSDGDDVGQVEAGGVEGFFVVVGSIVAGGGDEEEVGLLGVGQGLVNGIGSAVISPAVGGEDDIETFLAEFDAVVDGFDGAGDVAVAVGGDEFEGENFDVPGDAGDADGVVSDGGDGSGDVGAVAMVVGGVVVVVGEVPAVDVVDESVVVVVEVVVGDFAGIGENVGGKIGMGHVDARVDDGDDDVVGAGGEIPGAGGVDVGVGRAAVLAGVFKTPLIGKTDVVGRDRGDADLGVGLEGDKPLHFFQDVVEFGKRDLLGVSEDEHAAVFGPDAGRKMTFL